MPLDSGFRARLSRLLIMNTVLPIGEPLGPHSYEWRALVRMMPDLPVGQVIRHITPPLTDGEVAAYDAPFPDVPYKAGVRVFPELAMIDPAMPGVGEAKAALRFWSEEWPGRCFMAIGAKDQDVGTMDALRRQIRGCAEPFVVPEGGHFLPEWGEPVVRAALRFFGDL